MPSVSRRRARRTATQRGLLRFSRDFDIHKTTFRAFKIIGNRSDLCVASATGSANGRPAPKIISEFYQFESYYNYMYKNVLYQKAMAEETQEEKLSSAAKDRQNIGCILSVVEEYIKSGDASDYVHKTFWKPIVSYFLAAKCWAYLNALQMFGMDQQIYLCMSAIEINADWEKLPPKTLMNIVQICCIISGWVTIVPVTISMSENFTNITISIQN